jgi:hypothetical protein
MPAVVHGHSSGAQGAAERNAAEHEQRILKIAPVAGKFRRLILDSETSRIGNKPGFSVKA